MAVKYRIRESTARKAFLLFDYLFLSFSALTCLLPLVNMLAISFSSGNAAIAGYVKFLPVQFTLDAYKYVASRGEFWNSFLVSVERIALGLPLGLLVTVLTAYPMSKDSRVMPGRNFYTYFILIPMLFGGGLIPWFLTVRALGLTNNLLGLVIPGLVGTYYVILMMNFMRNLPKEIEESAFIDGAGPLTTLFKITLPLCLPSLATIALFTLVAHWNAWFDGIILMDSKKMYPLQSYLQSLIVQNDPRKMMNGSEQRAFAAMNLKTFKAAQIFIATVPVLAAYPFLQKYFTKGIVLGSVKG
jgi:putative aldouronate transport system permease protein